ncbi:hypothetical protein [Flavobacterium sp. HSC-61S13]|uniref:hypothetical protein n=1 Tax=Flavobacterium sp. HSC-61S13 TaxID=2910963 RepID=UPI00209F618C|nr:hypothetical protein [Flavobacterium sp. HSC-61S13]MCP1997300.1 hypothetical protein [Flavobacterium sp. HSC-61S13]
MKEAVESKAANILLERGVIVSVTAPLFLRIFGKKQIHFRIHALSLDTLLRVALAYLKLEIKDNKDFTLSESFELVRDHSKGVSRVVAIAILSKSYKMWLVGLVARFLRNEITSQEMSYIFQLIIVYGGVEDFINTIRLAGATRITMPMNLSQNKTS